MKHAHIFVSGRVQGVGYRYFVKSNARKVGVTGWVRNLPDTRVEAVLQGNKTQIEDMLARCRRGPMLSEVTDIEVRWEEKEQDFWTFEIRK